MAVPINPMQIDIFLQPGEVYFGDHDTRIRTVLGSCVSITFWHARRRIGGMCHYMLPERLHRGESGRDGKYADEALSLLFDEMRAAGTPAQEYEVKLFGGGRMFSVESGGGVVDIGSRNVEAGRRLLAAHKLHAASEHLAGEGHRSLIFDVATGDVWMRHQTGVTSLRDVA